MTWEADSAESRNRGLAIDAWLSSLPELGVERQSAVALSCLTCGASVHLGRDARMELRESRRVNAGDPLWCPACLSELLPEPFAP